MSLRKTLAMLSASAVMCFGGKAKAAEYRPEANPKTSITMSVQEDSAFRLPKRFKLHPSAIVGLAFGVYLGLKKKKQKD